MWGRLQFLRVRTYQMTAFAEVIRNLSSRPFYNGKPPFLPSFYT